jgi:NAD(P)H-dependent FMN reductase
MSTAFKREGRLLRTELGQSARGNIGHPRDAGLVVKRRLLLVSGSLRAESTNTALLRTAVQLAPESVDCSLYDGLARLPAFNPDDDGHPLPLEVERLRGAVHRADAVVFSTPEYAGALPGSFKNLLDWTIGDDHEGSIYDKPVSWLNASPRGADSAHRELRTVLGYAHARIIDAACSRVPITTAMIGTDGLVHDDASRDTLAEAMAVLTHALDNSRFPTQDREPIAGG